MSVKKTPWRQNVADEMIRHIEAGTAPWQKPWKAGVLGDNQHNPTSDHAYRGINAMWLEMQGHSDTRWMTLRQANEVGAKVRSGEKSTQVEYWQWTERKPKLDVLGNPELDENGKKTFSTVRLDRPKVFYANVFNAEQIDGLEPYKAPELSFKPVEEAEKLLAAGGVEIHHDQDDKAFYQPSRDQIHLPQQAAFPDAYEYYSTALHELGHATGHSSRMNRDYGPFGSEVYAKEELRAEMSSYMVARDLGLGHYPDRHAPYVENWLKAIKEDRNVLFQAARDAERISHWIKEPEMRPALEKHAKANRKAQKMDREKKVEYVDDIQKSLMEEYRADLEKNLNRMSSELLAQEYIGLTDEKRQSVSNTPEFDTENVAIILGELEKRNIVGEGVQKLVAKIQDPANDELRKILREEQLDIEHKDFLAMEEAKPEKSQRVYLAVPYSEKDQAKAAGAKWDRRQKAWYAPSGVDLEPLKKWQLENQPELKPEVNPVKEFADELKKQGVAIKGDPVMDGKWHRERLIDDKGKARNASYRGFLDGRPNGQIKNYKIHGEGQHHKWVATGETLTKDQLAALKAEAAEKQALRFAEIKALQNKAANAAGEKWDNAKTWEELKQKSSPSSAYLYKKQVQNYGLRVENAAKPDQKLLVPARDINGKLWSVQTIDEDGNKRFQKNARKSGVMHIIDPEQKIGEGLGYFTNKYLGQGSVLIAEGYATAASVHEATQRPTIVAFDAGNLKPVAEAVRKQYPHAKIVIAADNDHTLEHKPYGNVGKNKATEAALAVGGFMVAPGFDDEQKAKGLSDWNDLAQANGTKAIVEQMRQQLKRQRAVQKGEKPKRAALEM